MLVDHLTKLQVTSLGAGLLLRDMKDYEAMIRQFHIATVSEKFADLRLIFNLFFVSVDNLRAWLQEPRINKMDRQELHEFIKMRADYQQHKAKILAIIQS